MSVVNNLGGRPLGQLPKKQKFSPHVEKLDLVKSVEDPESVSVVRATREGHKFHPPFRVIDRAVWLGAMSGAILGHNWWMTWSSQVAHNDTRGHFTHETESP